MGLFGKIRHRNARRRFFLVTSNYYRWNVDSRGSVNDDLLELDTRLITQVNDFISARREHHHGICSSIIRVINRQDPAPRLQALMKHFDYTLALGWTYQGDVCTIIDKVLISGEEGLSLEQERALILLEDSHWNKEFVYDRAYREPQYNYLEFVREVVIDRPHDIERILALIQTNTIHHAAQLEALLDADIMPVLAEGAL